MTTVARALTKASAVTLAVEALFSAATGTFPGFLIAVGSFTAALYCWRYQRALRPAR